ncbi:hypothetical protein MLD38_016757 [Melastoma candidum]|uniref:Uncharacterized protein n=1 Tax=Melastoma candidum TaxID=119954 RepID=A0ACB9QNJ4_9MYRT|nr:hypothetical protein MLD38_016757 [Melastoma candidum]
MGWRIKQVSSEDDDGSDWTPSSLQDHRLLPMERENPQRQSAATTPTISSFEQLKCPRCGSTNTKFCYYNNYNKSQPRHFCKACKRHWTKGGTLRNVPVGGGRKNKRPRKKTSLSATSVTASDTSSAGERVDERKQQKLIFPRLSPHLEPTFHGASSAADHSVLQEFDDQFPWSGSSPFEVSSWQHPILTGAATMPMGLTCLQPWTFSSDCPETVGNSMNWDELDTLVSANLNIPWDDVDIKLP